MRPVIDLLIKSRRVAVALTLVLLAGLLYAGKKVAYEQSIQSFFSDSDPDIVRYRRASDLFGNDNFIFVCYEDKDLLTPAGMDRVRELARRVGPKSIAGIRDVQSIDATPTFWRLDDGLLALEKLPKFLRDRAFDALKKQVGKTGSTDSLSIGSAIRSADAKTLEELKKRIVKHPLLEGTLIDARGTTASIVARLKSTEEFDMKRTVATIRDVADSFAREAGLSRPAIVGPPVLLADGFANIERDGRRLALLGMILIGVVTYTAVRSVWWAVVPLLAGWVVWLATETILAVLGLKLSLSGGPLVAQIIVLTMPAASHLAIHFRDDLRSGGSREAAARSTLAAVLIPIMWCAVTGAIGYGVLLTSNLTPIRQFGAILGGCTLIAALLTMAIAPFAMLPPFARKRTLPFLVDSIDSTPNRMNRLIDWIDRDANRIVIGVIAIVVPVSLGVFRLEYESNYINVFKQSSRVVRDYRYVESRLGGIGVCVVVAPLPDGLNDASVSRLNDYAKSLLSLNQSGSTRIERSISSATLLDPEGTIAREPAAVREAVYRDKVALIEASPQAELSLGFWNPREKLARIMIRVPEQQPAGDKERTFRIAEKSARERFGADSFLTGLSFLMTRTARGVVATQWSTMIASIGGILLMLTLALRRARLAALALLPSLLAIVLVLGLMGWTGIKLDIATALVASVALGLSVDDTFHCLLQFHRMKQTESFYDSLRSSYRSTGPGVLLSSSAVAIGFAALWFSEFTPFANFGLMVCIATAGSSLGNLVLLPACLVAGERSRVKNRTREPIGEVSADTSASEIDRDTVLEAETA